MTEPVQPTLPLETAATAAAEAARSAAASQSSQSSATETSVAAVKPERPDYLPESFWDADKGAPKTDEFKSHLETLEKLKTDSEAKRAAVPEKPEGYKAELPQGLKLPEGISIDEKDPRLAELRTFAHANGLDQAQFSQILKLEADRVASTQTQLSEAIKLRDAAMGENGAARVQALSNWIDSIFPDAKDALQVKQTMWTPVICKFYENVQKLMTSQGVQSFNQTGREGAVIDDGKPSNWDQMSSIDRRMWTLKNPSKAA